MATEQFQGRPAAAAASAHRSTDARGRVIPLTEEEDRQRIERGLRALDEIDKIGDLDEQDATLAALLKFLDEEPL
jgi:hypothetical protein